MSSGIQNKVVVSNGTYLNNNLMSKKEIKFAATADPWRVIHNGLNIEAKCQTIGCNANTKLVWTHFASEDLSRLGDINLLQRIERVICPICKQKTPAETVYGIGFYNCTYTIDGMFQKKKSDQFENYFSGKGDSAPVREVANVSNGFIKYEGNEVATFWKFVQINVHAL